MSGLFGETSTTGSASDASSQSPARNAEVIGGDAPLGNRAAASRHFRFNSDSDRQPSKREPALNISRILNDWKRHKLAHETIVRLLLP